MKHVTFYYVRHGRTEYNRDHIIQGGRVDSPLTEDTLPAVRATAEALSSVDFARCYVSPLGRAQQTAQIVVGECSLKPKPLDALREFDFGELDGKPYKGHRLAFARCFVKQDFSSVGGESGEKVRARVRKAFRRMYQDSKDGDTVLVVGHGAYLRYMVLEFSRMSKLSRRITSLTMRVPNAGIATLICEGGDYDLVSTAVPADRFRPLPD